MKTKDNNQLPLEFDSQSGLCACGCGRQTRIVAGTPLKYFRASHHPHYQRNRRLVPRTPFAAQTATSQLITTEPRIESRFSSVTDAGSEAESSAERLASALTWSKTERPYIESWYKETAEYLNKKGYAKRRRLIDPAFRAMQACRSRLGFALKRAHSRKHHSSMELIGCSPEQLRQHIEAQFSEGMTWDNHGTWHIDHIKPCCSFDLSDPEQQRKCFHFSNLQPLWAEQNFKKRRLYTNVEREQQ